MLHSVRSGEITPQIHSRTSSIDIKALIARLVRDREAPF